MGGKSHNSVLQLGRKKQERKDYHYGAPKDIPVGRLFQDRQTLSRDMVHGFTQAGIHGSTENGAYSVVISGGYEDDEDHGDWFWYTGEGGRSPAGKQIRDQSWKDKGNKSLMMSTFYPRRPVRVIRGHIPESPYAPAEGLRYDGLYRVLDVRTAKGKSGYKICKALFKRLDDQPPLPPPRWPIASRSGEASRPSESHPDTIEISDSEEGSDSGPEEEEGEGGEEDTEDDLVTVAKSNSNSFASRTANMKILARKRQRSEDEFDLRVVQRPRESTVDPTCTLPEKANLFSAGKRKYQNMPKIAKRSPDKENL